MSSKRNHIRLIKIFFIVLGFFFLNTEGMKEDAHIPLKTTSHYLKNPECMPFKLGFEFQENNGLCRWALQDERIQKMPLFEVRLKEGRKTLWHVEIDTEDIEFVTNPFSFKEKKDLELCMQSIYDALMQLKNLITEKESNFSEWVSVIKENFTDCEYEVIQCNETIDLAKIKIEKVPADWNPVFSPQVTIQHPLEYTIGLYFVLLCSPEGEILTSNESEIVSSIPFLDKIPKDTENIKEDDPQVKLYLGNKGVGLIFLNALTMVCMTPFEQDDTKLLKQTFDSWKESNQFDAKMKLPIMSRRPFSSMFQDIKRLESPEEFVSLPNYLLSFQEAMKENKDFTEISEVPKFFYKANYAEQYSQDLSSHVNKFSDNLILKNLTPGDIKTPTSEQMVEALLQKGIISTTMIRNLKTIPSDLSHYFKEKYYEVVLKSVESPGHPTLSFSPKEFAPQKIDWKYDLLSPPIFLDLKTDAMGRYKEIPSASIKEFGEAIIEVRAIKNVGSKFLRLTELDKEAVAGNFLVNPECIRLHAMKLFEFLLSFGSFEKYDIIKFINAVRKKR